MVSSAATGDRRSGCTWTDRSSASWLNPSGQSSWEEGRPTRTTENWTSSKAVGRGAVYDDLKKKKNSSEMHDMHSYQKSQKNTRLTAVCTGLCSSCLLPASLFLMCQLVR